MLTATLLSLGIVTLAEMGDKSQLVCMLLASRYRPWPVFFGAITAFLILNGVAVTLGTSLARLLPMNWVLGAATLLFILFGLQSLLAKEDEEESVEIKCIRTVFITSLVMLFVSELGDKTQLSVVTMSLSQSPLGVWLGASLALIFTSALGVWLGKTVLARVNPVWLHRASGGLFLLMAAGTGWPLVLGLSPL